VGWPSSLTCRGCRQGSRIAWRSGGSDFAREGQGAKDRDDRDVETGQSRSQDSDSDIEGGSGGSGA